MNDNNLAGHGFHEIAADKQREIARKGGLARQEQAREERIIAKALRKVLDEPTDGGNTRMDIIANNVLGRLASVGDIRDLKTLAELLGEYVDKRELTGKDGADLLPKPIEIVVVDGGQTAD